MAALRADQCAPPAGVAEFRKKQDTTGKHGYCAILAEFPAHSAAVAGLFVNNRYRYVHVGYRCGCRKEEMEIRFLHIAVNKGDLTGLGEREGEVCGNHRLSGAALSTCNCDLHFFISRGKSRVKSPNPVILPFFTSLDGVKGFFIELLQGIPDSSAGTIHIQLDTCCLEHLMSIPANHSADKCFHLMSNNQLGCLWTNSTGPSGKLVFKGFK